MIKGLEAFTHGQIQDTLNILKIMERESIATDELKKHIENIVVHPARSQKGFLKKYSKAQREAMQAQRGVQRQPCKRCDEKRRGKKQEN